MLNFTVNEFNEIMADLIHNQLQLNQLCISGEITQFNYYSEKKHLYFTLSQHNAHLQCVIYNQHLKDLPVIEKGDQCNVIGQCKFLKNKGQLIFSGVSISMRGKGKKETLLAKRIETFKKAGKLSLKTSDKLPKIIEKICIITSEKSAAYFDIRRSLESINHPFETMFIPSLVQGLLAPNELNAALEKAKELKPDLICISRGGGANQDFDCFFDEALATNICKTAIPIICGIGHDINTTLTCLSANAAFSTPTAMIQWVIDQSLAPFIKLETALKTIEHDLIVKSKTLQNHLSELKTSANYLINLRQSELTEKINQIKATTFSLNPLSKLSNGFAYCENDKKKPILTIQQIKKNDKITLILSNGKAQATINNVFKN